MNKGIALRSEYQAGIAAVPARQRLRVIEGGLAQSKRNNRRATSQTPQKAQSQQARRPHARHDVAARPQAQAVPARAHALVALTLAIGLVVLAGLWRATDVLAQHRVQQALQNVEYQTIVVHSGDTLWDIAQDHAVHGCSTQELVRHIRTLNNVQDACLVTGMELTVPMS